MTVNVCCLTSQHSTHPGKRNKQTPKPKPTSYYCLSVWVSWEVLLISAGLGWPYLFSCIRCQLVSGPAGEWLGWDAIRWEVAFSNRLARASAHGGDMFPKDCRITQSLLQSGLRTGPLHSFQSRPRFGLG